jgi:hypothetical protein
MTSQWPCLSPILDGWHPVTVAGPRRSCTGLPLTTDRLQRRVYLFEVEQAAQALIAVKNQGDHVIGSHLQQAVEKALKASAAQLIARFPR